MTSPFEQTGDGVLWRGGGRTVLVQAWGRDSFRVRCVPAGEIVDDDWALLAPVTAALSIDLDGREALLRNGAAVMTMTDSSSFRPPAGRTQFRCHLALSRASDGMVLLEEEPTGGSLELDARRFQALPGGDFALTAAFRSDPTEHLVGMGLYQHGLVDLKGAVLELAHRNSQSSVPFVISSAGYGFFWHNPGVGSVAFGTNRTVWTAAATRQLDYWMTVGETPSRIAAAYAAATGHAPAMPEHGLGLWQSKLRYTNQEQLLQQARRYAELGIPLEVIVADFFHWSKLGAFAFDPEFWPDPSAMVTELAAMGTKLMVSVWPQIATDPDVYDEPARNNLLVQADRGLDIHWMFEAPSAFLDVTNPAARSYLWRKLRENYLAHGIDLFWLDEAEPEFGAYDHDLYRLHLGSYARVGNLYPQQYVRAVDDGLRDEARDRITLVRAAWAGSQRHGALVWSGDIDASFDALRRQIAAAISMGAAGIPWFTTDIGGFHGGDADDPAYRELFTRWLQFGAFCPVMRIHGHRHPQSPVVAADGSRRLETGGPNELWSFGDEVLRRGRELVALRGALRPYLREVMAEASSGGQPVVRGLFHDFAADDVAWSIADAFMLGPDILVAPITEPGATRRAVHLPAGARWRTADGRVHDGGQRVQVEADLDTLPVLLRDSSVARHASWFHGR